MNTLRQTFDQFYRDHVRLVFGMALGYGLDAAKAEDVVQETMLRAWRHFSDIQGMEKLAQRGWLVTTTRNVACTTRSKMLRPQDDMLRRDTVETDTRAALRIDVTRALSGLAMPDREIVILRYFHDHNSREIGEILGLPEGTVRRRLAECRHYLAAKLSAWQPEEVRK